MKSLELDSRERRALKNAGIRLLPALFATFALVSVLIGYYYFLGERERIIAEQQKLIVDAEIYYNNMITGLATTTHGIEVSYVDLIARGEEGKAGNWFIEEIKEEPMIDQIRILDLEGKETVRVNKGAGEPYIVPENDLQDKSDRYYYQEARDIGRNQVLFSDLDLNMENGEIEIDPQTGLAKPTFRISTPVYLNNVRIGYLVVNYLMRDYLTELRSSNNMPGTVTLLFDQNGYLLNCIDDVYNFGEDYGEGNAAYGQTVQTLFPQIDLQEEYGFFFEDGRICSYDAHANISDVSKDYYLSSNASDTLYFMMCSDKDSPYAAYINFSPIQSIADTWPAQLLMVLLITLVYIIMIFLAFLNNRVRFANYFAGTWNRKTQLKKALHNHEFINYYQPVVDIQKKSVVGVEALARWKVKEKILMPDAFMDEINCYELGVALDENTFLNVLSDKKKLEELGLADNLFISINISRQTFEDMIKENSSTIITLTEEQKKYIVFELLEDIIVHRQAAEKVRELYDQNVHFAIDDFGTGNSNIVFIRSFDNMKIKIDKEFVPIDVHNKKERVMIEAFAKMFVDQGNRLIVEGVETKEQYLYLKDLKVSGVQGYYFSKPLPLDGLIEFLEKKEYLDKL